MGAKKATPYRKKSAMTYDSIFEQLFEQLKDWVTANTNAAIGVGVAIVLVGVLAGGIYLHVRSSQARARSEFASIAARLPGQAQDNAADWKKVIPELQKFIADHGSSSAGLEARVELAKAYFETKSYAKAVGVGEEALKDLSRGSSLRPLILYQLGYAYEAAGKPGEAAKTWSALKQLHAPGLEREADWNLGRMYEAKKQTAKAIEMYELASQAPGEYPSTPRIDQRLSAIKIAAQK